MIQEQKMLEKLNRRMSEKLGVTYIALGLKPGEGGRLAPYMSGYEAAMADVRSMLQSILDEGEGK